MAIDNSILTHTIYLVCAVLSCTITHRKYHNTIRTFFVFLWATVIYFIVSCSILPIQFTNSGVHMGSFFQQFSIMSVPQFKEYFIDYLFYNISYFTSYLAFAFVGCILFRWLRKFWNAIILLFVLLAIHLGYNVGLNTIIDEVVKSVNAEDFLIMTLGFILGWICAKITLQLCPTLAAKILVKKSVA